MTIQVQVPITRDVQTTLNYCSLNDDQPPYFFADEPPAGVPRSNLSPQTCSVTIHDIRGSNEAFGLEISGFQFVKCPSAIRDFTDEEKIQSVYYLEVEEILKKYTGAKRVAIFDHTFRRSSDAQTACYEAPYGQAVHVDGMESPQEERLKKRLEGDADRLMKGRYRIINVWRPIANPVAHTPLAVADYRSFNLETDLIETRLLYPNREGRTYSFKYNPGHRWYYLSDQTPDDVIIFKCFDSDFAKARFAPHSAFLDRSSPANAPQRQSVEIRAMVFDTE